MLYSNLIFIIYAFDRFYYNYYLFKVEMKLMKARPQMKPRGMTSSSLPSLYNITSRTEERSSLLEQAQHQQCFHPEVAPPPPHGDNTEPDCCARVKVTNSTNHITL